MALRVSSTSVVLIGQTVNVVSGSLGIREVLLDWRGRAKTRLVTRAALHRLLCWPHFGRNYCARCAALIECCIESFW